MNNYSLSGFRGIVLPRFACRSSFCEKRYSRKESVDEHRKSAYEKTQDPYFLRDVEVPDNCARTPVVVVVPCSRKRADQDHQLEPAKPASFIHDSASLRKYISCQRKRNVCFRASAVATAIASSYVDRLYANFKVR